MLIIGREFLKFYNIIVWNRFFIDVIIKIRGGRRWEVSSNIKEKFFKKYNIALV